MYEHSLAELLVAGGTAGLLSFVLLHPVDVVKTLAQSLSPRSSTGSVWGHVSACVRAEGGAYFMRGLGPTCARAFAVNAVVFVVQEKVQAALSVHSPVSYSGGGGVHVHHSTAHPRTHTLFDPWDVHALDDVGASQ